MPPMTAQEIATILAYTIIGLLVVALLLLLAAVQQLRRGRKGPYWRLRRQASQRGSVLLLASIGLFVLGGALAFYSGLAALAFRDINAFIRREGEFIGVVVPTFTPTLEFTLTATPSPTASPTPTTAPTSTATPTLTATPTATATPTWTPTSTETPTPSATWTPSATVDSVLRLTPVGTGVPARANATIQLLAAADTLINNAPSAASTQPLPAGIRRIYLFITYEHMTNGVNWGRVLYRDGHPVQGQTYVWSLGEAGESYFFFGNVDGYPPGAYEVRLYLDAVEISRIAFTLVA
jgi:hypothetical protein